MSDAAQPQEKKAAFSNLGVRAVTALALIPPGIAGIVIGGLLWMLLLSLMLLIGLLEYFMLPREREQQGRAWIGLPIGLVILVGFYVDYPVIAFVALVIAGVLALVAQLTQPHKNRWWPVMTTLTGLIYVAFPIAFLAAIRNLPNGLVWLLVVFAVTWGTDTFAYFGGSLFGKRKLAPKLSPNKTIEGAISGVIGGILPAFIILLIVDEAAPVTLLWVVTVPFVAIAGDLLESALKRFFGVKDSHVAGLNVIPGHGGVLDRIDALLLVSAYSYPFIAIAA